MVVSVNYLGMLVDQTGKSKEQITFVEDNVKALDLSLQDKYPILKELPYNIVVNLEVAPADLHLEAEDEIALLPPFAGG